MFTRAIQVAVFAYVVSAIGTSLLFPLPMNGMDFGHAFDYTLENIQACFLLYPITLLGAIFLFALPFSYLQGN